MDVCRIFQKRNLGLMLSQFTQITSLPLLFINKQKEAVFSSSPTSITKFCYQSPIYVNGEIVGFLRAEGDKTQQLAFHFIKSRLEEILNNEYIVEDLIKTTANYWKEMNFFYNLMYDISSFNDVNEICESIIIKIIKMIKVDKAQIILLNEQNELQPIASYGFNRTGVLEKWILKNGIPLLLNDIENLPRELFIKDQETALKTIAMDLPLVAVPLKAGPNSIGVLKVCQKKNRKIFCSDDLKLLTSIGCQVGMAVNNMTMFIKLRDSEKIKKEMELASQIQNELLPKKMPSIPHLDIAGRCISANAVGGDYYDFFLGDDLINFVLADVSGHGVSAALIMSNVRSTLRGLFSEKLPLSDVAYRLNNFVVSDSGTSGMFVTLFYLRYFFSAHKIAFINCGQTPPILFKSKDQSIERLDTGGSPAGFFDDVQYEIKTQQLDPGDVLIIFTDGFTEAINRDCQRFGDANLIDLLVSNHKLSSEKIIDKIYESVYDYSDDLIQNDDMTILAIKRIT